MHFLSIASSISWRWEKSHYEDMKCLVDMTRKPCRPAAVQCPSLHFPLGTLFSFQSCPTGGGIVCLLNWHLYTVTMASSITSFYKWFTVTIRVISILNSISVEHGSFAASHSSVTLEINLFTLWDWAGLPLLPLQHSKSFLMPKRGIIQAQKRYFLVLKGWERCWYGPETMLPGRSTRAEAQVPTHHS